MNKYKILFLLLVLLFSCNQKSTNLENNFTIKDNIVNIKKIIIQQYNTFDSIYYSQKDNCSFSFYIENELDSINLFYTNILENILIKNLKCPYTDFEFSIINFQNNFYYIGFSDNKFYEKVLQDSYYIENMYLISKTDSLQVISTAQRETNIFNEIFKNEKVFQIENTDNELIVSEKISLAANLIFETYQNKISDEFYKPILNEIFNLKLKLYEYKNISDINLYNTNIQYILDKYLMKTSQYDNKMYYFEYEGKGLVILNLYLLNNQITVDKIFIPSMKYTIFNRHTLDPPTFCQ